MAMSGLIVLVAPVQAGDEGGNASSANAPTGAGSSAISETRGTATKGAPNSARPTNSDGTPAKPENYGTLGTTDSSNPREPRMRSQTNREEIDPKIISTWVKGATVPQEYHSLFVELPPVEQANVVVRYRGGRVFYINQNDWKIVRVVELDPGVPVPPEDAVFVEGYLVPAPHRERFVEVPTPDDGVSVRIYDGTAYYTDPHYRITRTVKLASK